MPEIMESTESAEQTTTIPASDFERMMGEAFEFEPESSDKRDVEKAVKTLSEQALEGVALVPDNAISSIKAIIAEIDYKLSGQINEILHHEDFQQLESRWRGLHHLVNNTETGEQLKISVRNISKKELRKELETYAGTAWDQSPTFKKVYEAGYGTHGGEPLGAIVGDYYFDHTPPDVSLLASMAKISAAAHTPFITAPSPSLMNFKSWQELSDPRDLAGKVSTVKHAAWNALREAEDSRYIGLAMPRFLARVPYGAATKPVDEFAFEEEVDGSDHSRYSWANAAYAMAVNINKAFKLHGWCVNIRGIESGGNVEGLPLHTFPTDSGGEDMKCPTEISITDRREGELSKLGMMPLLHKKNSTEAVFIGAQSLQIPKKYHDPEATASAELSARLPYLFAANRFAHYLKVMMRNKIGTSMERDDVQKFLNDWIMNYVTGGSTEGLSDELKAEKPLSEAKITVEDVEGNPGYYDAKIHLRPHFQFEGIKASLSLVSKLKTTS